VLGHDDEFVVRIVLLFLEKPPHFLLSLDTFLTSMRWKSSGERRSVKI